MSQCSKAEGQWNKVFHERPTENLEESKFFGANRCGPDFHLQE